MNNRTLFQRLILSGAVVLFFTTVHGNVRHITSEGAAASETLAVWVQFTDKAGTEGFREAPAPSALARRLAAGYTRRIKQDAPVVPQYVRSIEALGGRLRHTFKWENTASFELCCALLPSVERLPFVKSISLVGHNQVKTERRLASKQRSLSGTGSYGTAFDQLTMLAVPDAHGYLRYLDPQHAPGTGVRIAFFDSGFRLDHRCFRQLRDRGGVKGMWDFIDNDATVADPDSVNRDPSHPLWTNDMHGSAVLACAVGYDPPYYCGVAWGADILLARTEDTYTDSLTGIEHELHAEEDNWAAAVVWAESLGVDIISSSLGYRYDFQDTIILHRNNGTVDTIVDYLKSDLDGATTIVSRAAKGAVERGVLIVNAAGNEQNDGDTSIGAPADVDGVIAVGSVNLDGTLSYFSSLGPSADGRRKPDVTAPGYRIALPDLASPQSTDYSRVNSGTSFATPLVAGVCALIKHSFPDATAEDVRGRLYRYCRFPSGIAASGNRYGNGIPDALRSCMRQSDEVFLSATDTSGLPLTHASIVDVAGDTIGRTDSSGITLFHVQGAVPFTVSVVRGSHRRTLTVDKIPLGRVMAPCSLVINVRSDHGVPLAGALVGLRADEIAWNRTTDSSGVVVIEKFFPVEARYVVYQPGYSMSDTISSTLSETRATVTVTLQSTGRPLFEVFPTVVRRSRGEKLTVNYAGTHDSSIGGLVTAVIRSVNGALVWRKVINVVDVPVKLQWDGRCSSGLRAAPGLYFFNLSSKSEKLRARFIIAE